MIRCAGIKGKFSINSYFPHPSLARDLSCGLVQPWSSRRTGACKEDGEEKVFCRRPRCFLLILHGRPVGSIMYRTFYIERPRLVGAAEVPVSSEYMICSHIQTYSRISNAVSATSKIADVSTIKSRNVGECTYHRSRSWTSCHASGVHLFFFWNEAKVLPISFNKGERVLSYKEQN
jgi:hypothetical protein